MIQYLYHNEVLPSLTILHNICFVAKSKSPKILNSGENSKHIVLYQMEKSKAETNQTNR